MTRTEPAAGTGLLRAIRKWDLVALVLNVIVGAGIFGLPSQVYALAADDSLLAYVACAVAIFLIVLCFAEVSSRSPRPAGCTCTDAQPSARSSASRSAGSPG